MKKYLLLLSILIISLLILSCSMEKNESFSNDLPTGRAGSLARFNVVGDYLYSVTPDQLFTFNLESKEHPIKVSTNKLAFFTETIFAYDGSLLLGTDQGIYVYDISNPATPYKKATFYHIRSCDPVVAQGDYAYVTLNTQSVRCFNGKNLLQIIDIDDYDDIELKSETEMKSPLGLAINNDTLFVCDEGLVVFNVENKQKPLEINRIENIKAKDVICDNGTLIITGDHGIRQYSYKNGVLELLSTIHVVK